jgi:hypothetical protein
MLYWGQWENELVMKQPPVGKNVSTEAKDIVRIRHQATTDEDAADWEDSVRAVVTTECVN